MGKVIHFSNLPGHHEWLVKIGLLAQDETHVMIDELIERAFQTTKIKELCDVFSVELINQRAVLEGIELTVQRAQRAIKHIESPETLQLAVSTIEEVEKSLVRPKEQAIAIQSAVDIFERESMARPERQAAFTSEVQAILTSIQENIQSINSQHAAKRDTTKSALSRMRITIQEKAAKFTS